MVTYIRKTYRNSNPNSTSHFKFVFFIPFIFILHCASINVSKIGNFNTIVKNINRITVVTDGLIAVQSINNYYSITETKKASTYINEMVPNIMIKKGFYVPFSSTPVLGGFLSSDTLYPISEPINKKIIYKKAPFFIEDSNNVEFNQSLNTVSSIVFNKFKYTSKELDLENDKAQSISNIIKKKLGSQYILFVYFFGSVIPPAKSIAQAVVTGVASTALTGGLLTAIAWQSSACLAYVALVDVDSQKILWKNKTTFTGDIKEEIFFYNMIEYLLKPFPIIQLENY